MNKIFNMIKNTIMVLLISSCSVDLDDYKNTRMAFSIDEYFHGRVTGWGIVQDYSNQVIRRFCVEIIGTWENGKGKLAETFYFNDGEISYRNWQLSKQNNGNYHGLAEDVTGIAIGQNQGFAFQFTYDLRLKYDDEIYQVSMDDWMYQLDEHRVMNKTSMKKFGIRVAEITLFFDKALPYKNYQ